jgi:hypothetical protein
VLDEFADTTCGRTLQVACVYCDFSVRLAQRIGSHGSLDVIDVLPVQLQNLRRKLTGSMPGGKWVRYGDSEAGRQAQGIYEDRITMFVDDGSVPEFARYGGYVAVGNRMRFFTDEAKPKELRAHPYLGQKLKQTEVRKYLPATRRDIND